MTTLRTAFNDLVTSMKRYDLYQIDDEVGMGVQNLSDKIDEVYNRITCVINTNKDTYDILSIYEDIISFDDLELLERIGNDIDIAMDLTDNEPISENWYGLFAPKNDDEIVPRETNISVDDVVKVAMELGMNPSIEEINGVMGYYNSEAEQDPTATWELIVENLLYNCVAPSQQTIEDKVEHSGGGIPYRICNECVIKEEEDVMNMQLSVWLCNDCIPPTSQCSDTEVHGIVKEVIANLKDIQVDGETMDYIIKELGCGEYLLRSLVMKSSFKDTKDLLKEKILLSDKK